MLNHFDELIFSNIDGGSLLGLPHHDTIRLPDGQTVQSATPGDPSSITYWLNDGTGYSQISEDQAFVQSIWLHAVYGDPVTAYRDAVTDALNLSHEYTVTQDEFFAAAMGLEHVAAKITELSNAGVTADQMWDYVQGVAPNAAVDLVGVIPSF